MKYVQIAYFLDAQSANAQICYVICSASQQVSEGFSVEALYLRNTSRGYDRSVRAADRTQRQRACATRRRQLAGATRPRGRRRHGGLASSRDGSVPG